MLEDVHEDFGITGKFSWCVTDSGSNFVKAFKHFSLDEVEDFSEGDETYDGDSEFQLLDNAMELAENIDDEQVLYRLPPHRRCACHMLNLIATTDVQTADTGVMKRVSVQTFSKLSALWNKQNRSTLAAERIKGSLGKLLRTPGDTRWNSVHDAVLQVKECLSVSEQEMKFDKLMDELDIKCLQPMHKTFVHKYVKVMSSLCGALDVLQAVIFY